jgi:ApbE superfamily uncharacterized protein (UPF0280 family)
MTTQSRTEITVETERVLIIRQRRSVRAWCQECGCEVEMVSLGEAEAFTALSRQQSRASAQAFGWHMSETQQGVRLVCLESLRKWL